MRSALLVVLLAVPAFAEEFEVFVDRGDTYVRAGSDQGLQRGVAVTVVAKGGKKLGSATVMETWPALARISLDEAARSDKSASKYVSLAAAAAKAAEPVAPPPPPPPPAAGGALKGFAKYGGAGPWTALQVFNENGFDWNGCTITMLPVNASYQLKYLQAGDHELIGRSNFTNRDFEGDPTSVRVKCKEGEGTLPIR